MLTSAPKTSGKLDEWRTGPRRQGRRPPGLVRARTSVWTGGSGGRLTASGARRSGWSLFFFSREDLDQEEKAKFGEHCSSENGKGREWFARYVSAQVSVVVAGEALAVGPTHYLEKRLEIEPTEKKK